MHPVPYGEYADRLARHRALHDVLERRERLISNLRLIIFLSMIGALVPVVVTAAWVHALWLIVPCAGFIAAVVVHDVTIRRRDRAAAALRYYERALARVEGRWVGMGIQRTQGLAEEAHPYAADLDLFGEASLFELLCGARTRAGELALARWLLAPAAVTEVRKRQQAVEELRSRLDLREDLTLLGGGLQAEVSPEALYRWGEGPAAFSSRSRRALRIAAGLLTVAAAGGILLWALSVGGPLPLLGVAALELVLYRSAGAKIRALVQAVDQAGRSLAVLAGLAIRLEQETFTAPLLVELQHQLTSEGRPLAAAIRRLDHLVTWLDAQRNQLFAPLAYLLLWPLHFGLLIESWRLRTGPRIRLWLTTIGEFEALCSLSAYAYEHPEDPFPELVEEGPLLRGEALGHPLLPDELSVCNDVELDGSVNAWIVSGSNMSGKTTLLRTLGINVVLALAGAPVRARSLVLSPLAVGATIRIHDSLQARRSRFYAEIQRLKQLMELAEGPLPLLFLLDEILHGTNSRDRRIGATALLHQLVARRAIGLVTTHDLAIAEAADELKGRVENHHFRDELRDGQLVFDYLVRPGVVQGSNALALMQAVGLEIKAP